MWGELEERTTPHFSQGGEHPTISSPAIGTESGPINYQREAKFGDTSASPV